MSRLVIYVHGKGAVQRKQSITSHSLPKVM